MATNTYEISLTTQPFVKKTPIKVVQGDIDANLLKIKIFNNSVELNYATLSEVTITFVKPDYRIVQVGQEEGVAITDTGITYTLNVHETAVCGSIKASLQILGTNGERTSIEDFRFDVVPDLVTPAAVQSTSEFPILNRLLFEANNTEQQREEREEIRITNEDGREAAEIARASAETIRDASETSRLANEDARGTNEFARVSAESERASAETSRAAVEVDRVTAENNRILAEQARATAESSRASAEAIRDDSETERISNESSRVTAESGRVTAESSRATAETGRVTAESGRVTAESGRVTAENNRVTAESSRASAETTRASSETARRSQETTRQSNETTRQTQETTRQASMADMVSRFSTLTTQQQQDAEVIDARKGEVSLRTKIDLIDTQYNDIANKVNTPTYSTPTEATASVISLPATTVKGQFNVLTLKGNTVTNPVKNGNFANGTTGWSGTYISNAAVNAGVYEFIGINTGAYVKNDDLALVIGHKYYVSAEIKADSNAVTLFCNSVLASHAGNGNFQKMSVVFDAAATLLRVARDGRTSGWTKNYIKNVYVIDLTAHGLDTLIVDQCNQRFPNWLSYGTKSTLNQRVTSYDLKNEAVYNKDTWAEWTKSAGVVGNSTGLEFTADGATMQSAILNTSLKANTKYGLLYYVDSSSIAGSISAGSTTRAIDFGAIPKTVGFQKDIATAPASITSNTLIIYVAADSGAGTKIKLRDIRIFELPTGSQIETDFNTLIADQLATKYPYFMKYKSFTETYTPEVGKSLPNGTKDELNVSTGVKTQKVSDTQTIQSADMTVYDTAPTYNDVIYVNKQGASPASFSDSRFNKISSYGQGVAEFGHYFSNGNLRLVVPKGTYANLAAAQTALTGLSLTYQLAVPVPTQIEGLSQLIAESNGSIIIEPAVKDVATYGVNIAIGNTALAIKTLERVTKIVINPDNSRTETDIAISTCTVAPDGLSYTSTALALGDKVEYSYLYDSALTTLPTINYSYPMNLKAVVEGDTKMIAQVSKDVAELNDFTVAYLLNIEARLTAHSI